MISRQREILLSLAKHYGISVPQAEEIWSLFGATIASTISSASKDSEGMFDSKSFRVIHIDNFGKFIPNKRKINYANHCLAHKNKNNEHNTSDSIQD